MRSWNCSAAIIREIKIETIKAIGVNPSEKTLPPLFDYLNNFEKEVLESLMRSRCALIAVDQNQPALNQLNGKTKIESDRPLRPDGRTGGASTLFSLLKELPCLQCLQSSEHFINRNSRPHLDEKKQVEDMIKMYLVIAAEILHMHRRINPKKEVYELLHNSLQIELDDIMIMLLCLFSFFYDSDKINKIRSALSIQKKATIANAMELVDMTVRKDFARPFTVIFESGDIEHRCNRLKDLFPSANYFRRWIRSCTRS